MRLWAVIFLLIFGLGFVPGCQKTKPGPAGGTTTSPVSAGTPSTVPSKTVEATPSASYGNTVVEIKVKEETEFFGKPKEEYERLESDILDTLRNESDDETTLVELAHVYIIQRKFEKGEEIGKKILSINPESVKGHLILADSYRERKMLKEAVVCLNKAIKLDPKNASAYTALGKVTFQMGDHDKALEYNARAIEMAPKHAEAYAIRVMILHSQGELDKALEYNARAIEMNPKCAEAYIIRAKILKSQGEFDKAEKALKDVLKFDPENKYAKEALARIREVEKVPEEGMPFKGEKGKSFPARKRGEEKNPSNAENVPDGETPPPTMKGKSLPPGTPGEAKTPSNDSSSTPSEKKENKPDEEKVPAPSKTSNGK